MRILSHSKGQSHSRDKGQTRSSDVAVVADRTGELSNRFRLQV